jgi:hypothetical protein
MMTDDGDARQRLTALGLKSIPKILTLQDRNAHSATYGCFDRSFWHLRVSDFPSGMSQEFVWPLALAWAHPFEANPFHGNATIRDWVVAGIDYAAKSAHADGSCDDYYPFEKASGAAAFSLLAMVEALRLIDGDPAPVAEFLLRRARWLGRHEESGRLSNHEALIANGLLKLSRLVDAPELVPLAERRVDRLLSWQSEEGWFFEYQGADPGYLTLTLANMAEIDEALPGRDLRPAIIRGVDFLHAVQPPDGWIGGEWTSRNTNNFFPHGLETIGAWYPKALEINTRAVAAMNPAPEYDDDRILGHHSWSYLKAALDWQADRPAPQRPEGDHTWPEAGIAIRRRGAATLLAATKKGGSFRLYSGETLTHADTGVSLQVREKGKRRTYVCHLWSDDYETTVTDAGLEIAGPMGRAKTSGMTPWKNVVLRLLMLSVGRFNPDLIRRLLQRLLITGHDAAPFRFHRTLALDAGGLTVTDRIDGQGEVVAAGIGPAQTSIYTVMARVYHPPQLQPWHDLTPELRDGPRRLDVTRRIAVPAP